MFLGLAAAMYIAWNLGANDAANPTNMAVGSGAMTIRKAVLLFSVFAAVGALLQGYMVIKTIGRGVVSDVTALGALVSSIAAGLWVTTATYKGLPVSTTHSTVGAVLGVGVANILLHGGSRINLSVVYKVMLSWVASPLAAISLSIIFYFLFYRITRYYAGRGADVDKALRMLFFPALAFSAYAYGTNDFANATGVYVSVVSKVTGFPDIKTMYLLAFLGSIGIMAGAFTWGPRVIQTVGYKITRLDLVSGVSAELANALSVWLFTTVPALLFGYGMPISTTHASVSSVIGVGLAKHRSLVGINWKTVGIIFLSWVLTLPIAMLLSMGIYTGLSLILGVW
jgi:PiT family inorganic phosphate transporter